MHDNGRFRFRVVTLAAVASGLTASTTLGDTLYATGFEPGAFQPGVLAGQDDIRANLGISIAAANVMSDAAYSGSQGVRIEGDALDLIPEFGVYAGSYVRDVAIPQSDTRLGDGDSTVIISSMIRIDSTPEACTVGISLLDRSGVSTLGFVGIDLATSETFVSNAILDEIRGAVYTYGEWAQFTGIFNFDTGTLKGYYNNALIGTLEIIDQQSGVEASTTAPFTGAEMVIVSPAAIPNTVAEFDDFSVLLVPAPGSVCLAVGTLALLMRRRRS